MEIPLIHFLLVEDDDDHAELMMRTLRKHRLRNTIDRVPDGMEAMAYLRRQASYADRPRPGIILLDLNMPRLSGHEVLRQVKEDTDLRTIPVVILTTSDAETDRVRCYTHHANSYLVKPVDFQQFSKMVEDLSLYWGVWNKPGPAAGGTASADR
jgi:CheY-like chemotaxis protein